MRADIFLDQCAALPIASLQNRMSRGLVIVAPHPDDEALGCGGLIAEALALGLTVSVIVLSDGAGSHPRSRHYPKESLVALRQTESLASAAILGLDGNQVTFLGLPDGAVPVSRPVIDAIVAAVRSIDADAIVATWAHDPHCDHQAAAAAVDAAHAIVPHTTVYSYPIWGWTLPLDHEIESRPPTGFRLDIERHRAAKAKAIAAHQSQINDLIEDDPDGFRLTPTMLANFVGRYEIFIDVTPRTSATGASLPADYFVALYSSDPDPWRFASSPYETAKYKATLAALPSRHFMSVLEIGCSIGVLTHALAPRCSALLAIDVADSALHQARARCADLDHVVFSRMQVPGEWPAASFDMILASEVLYYLDVADLDYLAARIASSLRSGGTLLLVHWTHDTDYPLSGDAAVNHLIAALGSTVTVAHQARTDDYRLDRLTRV